MRNSPVERPEGGGPDQAALVQRRQDAELVLLRFTEPPANQRNI